MPKVYNKKHNDAPPEAVYIGRGSVYGNPFTHLTYGQAVVITPDRETAVRYYRLWVNGDPDLIKRVNEASRRKYGKPWLPPTPEEIAQLRDKDVVCWCAPQACHGDVLIEMAN